MPPEYPKKIDHLSSQSLSPHLYYLLRPELVKMSLTPLCPDAFSCFMSNPKEFINETVNLEMKKYKEILPQFIATLDRFSPDDPDFDLIYELHHHGFNVR